MHFTIVSLFPEFFASPLHTALLGRAEKSGLLSFSFVNPRDFAPDKHRTVDDRPYGGGPGMLMQLEPLVRALRSAGGTSGTRCARGHGGRGPVLVPSPGAQPFTQERARELAALDEITLVCGRYEGFDKRLEELVPLEYLSCGEAVFNGGEVAALMIVEAVARLIPGFMGKEESGNEESFSGGLLEYPQYTRPEEFEGLAVPELLRSGDHQKIALWRRQQALAATLRLRPELFAQAELDEQDAFFLRSQPRETQGRKLYLCLAHYPVLLKSKNPGASSLTNLDIHDIARNSCAYGLGGFYVSSPLEDQTHILQRILHYWTQGPGARLNPDRARALEKVQHVVHIKDAVAQIEQELGQAPLVLGTSADWQDRPVFTPHKVRKALDSRPVLLVFGTAHGLAPEALEACDGILRPLRFLSAYRHLSVRAAAAIYLDRILNDIH